MTRRCSLPGLASMALLAVALGTTALPAHAFWGLLGKAAGSAGKAAGTAGKAAGAVGAAGAAGEAATAAGTAGKAAAAGAGAGAATLADDAARAGAAGSKTAAVDGAAGGAAHGFSAVNAALPPEVALYLAKPAARLTGTDTAAMMDLYQRMVAQAGKTGDFSVLERMPQVHGAKTLPQPASRPVPVPVKAGATAPSPSPSPATAPSPSTVAEMNLAGLRLLAHAGSAGHRAAQSELRARCADPAVLRTSPPDVQALCKAALAIPPTTAARPRPSAS